MISNGIIFGTGELFLKDAAGQVLEIAELKDVSISFDQSIKEFFGSQIYAQDVAITQSKISGKMKSAVVKGEVLGAILGGKATSGIVKTTKEIKRIAEEVTVAHGDCFVENLGVVDAETGAVFEQVASDPAEGQYVAGSAGVGAYRFASADTGDVVIRYSYTSPVGNTISVSNSHQGPATGFVMHLSNTYGQTTFGMKLFRVVIPRLNLALKSEDYVEVDLDFNAIADGRGRVYEKYLA